MRNTKFNSLPEKDEGRFVQGTIGDIPGMNHYNILHPISLYIFLHIQSFMQFFKNVM